MLFSSSFLQPLALVMVLVLVFEGGGLLSRMPLLLHHSPRVFWRKELLFLSERFPMATSSLSYIAKCGSKTFHLLYFLNVSIFRPIFHLLEPLPSHFETPEWFSGLSIASFGWNPIRRMLGVGGGVEERDRELIDGRFGHGDDWKYSSEIFSHHNGRNSPSALLPPFPYCVTFLVFFLKSCKNKHWGEKAIPNHLEGRICIETDGTA